MPTQPQLLSIALNPRDVVYTPDDVARDDEKIKNNISIWRD